MIRLATDCSGIGAPEQALKDLGVEFKSVFACERDKYARITYMANHHTEVIYEDLTTRPHEIYSDLYVAGYPCQAFSIAGKRMGEGDTRGVLFYHGWEYIKTMRPRWFVIENVKGLLSVDDGKIFQTWIDLLAITVNGQYSFYRHEDCVDYHVFWTVLNSKDFGVPQNRERVFIVGCRDEADAATFSFPIGWKLPIRLKDILEKDVPEKYYLSDKLIQSLTMKEGYFNGRFTPTDGGGISQTLTSRYHKMGATDPYIQEPPPSRENDKFASETNG